LRLLHRISKNYTKIVLKLYFFNEKRLLIVFLFMVMSISLFSQEEKNVIDTLSVKKDTLSTDTATFKYRLPSENAIDKKVNYTAAGLIKRDIINKKVTLVDQAVVNYGEIEIKADSIVFDMNTNLLFAIGKRDTAGKVVGTPVFKEGSNEFEAKELTYNFKTRRAFVRNIVTKQDEGLIHSQYTKLLEDGTSNIAKSTYSTCDSDTPHFYINLPKARVYPGDKLVSGPGNLVLEGIPLPLVIPFGYFPVQTKKAASGILFPKIGEERERGFSITEGGYYFAVSDFFDLSVKGNLYANGSWMATAMSSYNKLYKYSGNFQFNYANNISGHKGLPDYSQARNYRVGWSFFQDAKASPGSRFSASVNLSSSEFEKENSYNVAEHATTQKQSSVSYSKSWIGTPFNLSASMNHSQNNKNKTVNLNLPKVSFSMGRIYPFKSKRSIGPSRWYQDLQFQYTAAVDNRINITDSLLFTSQVFDNMQSGFKHEAPLSLQIRPFKNFSISPSLTYSAVMYTQQIEKVWDPTKGPVISDTIKGVTYGQSIRPAITASYNPQVFGMYTFINPDSRVQAIRHVIKPTIGFSYIPVMEGLSSDMYRTVTDDAGNEFEYSKYEGNIFGTPSLSQRSGSVSFGLVNIVEAKVFAKDDTTGTAKKVKIIDNFGINTSYNIFADSMNWAPVTMQMRTTLMNNINLSVNSVFSLYGINEAGRMVSDFALKENSKLMRLTNFGTTVTFSLSQLLSGNKKKGVSDPSSGNVYKGMESQGKDASEIKMEDTHDVNSELDEYGYPFFDVPWSLNVTYTLSYSKPSLISSTMQTLGLTGDVTVTKKMKATYMTGYEFKTKQITMSSVGIRRDLHCWEMNFNWYPIGTMKGWNFTIRVKASVLGDLKYERRKDYHDNY